MIAAFIALDRGCALLANSPLIPSVTVLAPARLDLASSDIPLLVALLMSCMFFVTNEATVGDPLPPTFFSGALILGTMSSAFAFMRSSPLRREVSAVAICVPCAPIPKMFFVMAPPACCDSFLVPPSASVRSASALLYCFGVFALASASAATAASLNGPPSAFNDGARSRATCCCSRTVLFVRMNVAPAAADFFSNSSSDCPLSASGGRSPVARAARVRIVSPVLMSPSICCCVDAFARLRASALVEMACA